MVEETPYRKDNTPWADLCYQCRVNRDAVQLGDAVMDKQQEHEGENVELEGKIPEVLINNPEPDPLLDAL